MIGIDPASGTGSGRSSTGFTTANAAVLAAMQTAIECGRMGRLHGSRTLIVVCGALAVLLGALAVVQFRWSSRVAAADAEREKEHLQAAASLFAAEFNGEAQRTVTFLERDAWNALQSGRPLSAVPKLLAEVYYRDLPERGPARERKLIDGHFVPASLPEWAARADCAPLILDQPLALSVPIFDDAPAAGREGRGVFVLRTVGHPSRRCFVARIDDAWLRGTLLPQLIRRSFGATESADYDFAVVARPQASGAVSSTTSSSTIYGRPLRPDIRVSFFGVSPADLGPDGFFQSRPGAGHSSIIVQRMESTIVTGNGAGVAPLFGEGAWELLVAHRGMPLASAFEQTRRRDLLFSLGVEALLLAAMVFLVIAARRVERLAGQKMSFVAGVSHELRTPVSAISMLSRNQADGLVTGAERVRQYGELIHQQSRRLNEMVEQTLQYAGIHSGVRPAARNPVDVGRLVQETVDARRTELERAGFAVEIEVSPGLPPVEGDVLWLRTAVDNLLSNAQKHAGAGHWMRVTAAYAAAEKEVRISVEDHGSGIDPADQAEIFQPFSRGRAAIEAQIPGAGLGLSLVRSAVEAHRGSVTLVSRPGLGSTFTLHLPV